MTPPATPGWFGDARPALPDGVALEETSCGLRLRATRALAGLATGRFDRPSASVDWRPAPGPGRHLGGTLWTQFGLPVAAAAPESFRFVHGRFLFGPEAIFPLWGTDEHGDALLLAPLDAFHEQVVAVEGGTLRWGWQGDLEAVPEGFSSELGIFTGPSLRRLLDAWGALLRERSGIAPTDADASPLLTHLSYWTDNGAAYWYRTEAGRSLADTLAAKADELRAAKVPVHAFELDSWFYPHEALRPVDEVGYPSEVPPSGMMRWKPREDLLPDGIPALRERLGDPPLVLHSRHIAAASPYVDGEEDWWTHGALAHPKDPAFFRRWFADAKRWGAAVVEQDWMSATWLGVKPLREAPGRIRAWQRGLDAAAREFDQALVWCMATPGDFAAATEIEALAAIRTCDDYRYAEDPAFLWRWFLVQNAVARALGLRPFKDVFFSKPSPPGPERIDGDPHAELEAALAALSSGPVGIGDRIGRTERDVVLRCCREDGVLVKPDTPIAALDGCLLGEPERGERLLWAGAETGPWRYLLAIHAAEGEAPIEDVLTLEGAMLVYDWRAETAEVGDRVACRLEHRDWRLFVACPIEDGHAWIGDPKRYATLGAQRIRIAEGTAELRGAAGERVTIRRWSAIDGLYDAVVELPEGGLLPLR